MQNAAVYDASVDADGDLPACPGGADQLGDCGGSEVTIASTASGASAGVIAGSSLTSTYHVQVDAGPAALLVIDCPMSYQVGDGGECTGARLSMAWQGIEDPEDHNLLAALAGDPVAVPVRWELRTWVADYQVVVSRTDRPTPNEGYRGVPWVDARGEGRLLACVAGS